MAKKKASVKKSLVQAKEAASSAILSHPVFQDMRARMETMQSILEQLPQVIGQAVAEATRQAPQGASGPAIPLVDVKEVELAPRKMNIDGKLYDIKRQPPRQVVLRRVTGVSVNLSDPITAIAAVVRLGKDRVLLRPIDNAPELEATERAWSLLTGKLLEGEGPWQISKLDLEVLVKCAAEV